MSGRHVLSQSRSTRVGVAVLLVAGAVVPIVLITGPKSASASTQSTYTPGVAQLATITDGTSTAPWNEWQGDPGTAAYASVSPGTVLPTYTPGGATTGSGSSAEPNLSVVPSASSGTPGTSPYPSGTVGTPGPLDGYCGTGNQAGESAGTPARQPAGTTLPLAPAYFPHIVSNSDGSLTGYFDYRPKDADEAVEVARSTDGGKSWTYEGEALEQNPGYCPSDDINDDGNGHPYVLTVNGVTRLYTLQRAAGDTVGVGMLAHTLTPTTANPLNGAPASEKVGIDPDAFVPTGDGVTVPHTGGTTITLTTTGTANSTEQLVAGGFVDLTRTPTPTASSVITCTGVGTTTLTGCTAASSSGETVAAGDLIEQVIGYVTSGPVTISPGPNNSAGTGGVGTINVVTTAGGSTKGFTNSITGTTYNSLAPNRAYIDGVAVYCNQSNANPTTKMENCTTGPGGSTLSAATGDPITSDPIVPATATMTSGLVAPDGIVGVLPSYPGAPSGSTIIMYTEKVLNYYVAGTTTNTSSSTFGSSIAFTPSSFESQDMPSVISSASPVVVEMGDNTKGTIVAVTCTGLTVSTTDTLTGCSVPSGNSGDKYSATSLIGAPGAAVVAPATLAQIGEGSTSSAKLFKNNEDLAVVRVAYTTDGLTFSTTGLANGGVISGASNGASNYTDLSNPSTTVSPSNLNAYATPGTADAIEMRWAGSAGSIITNPDGSYGLFLSGSWAADGDSDAYNQIYYSSSTDGENWTIPTTVVSTDYTFSASVAQDTALAAGSDQPLGISAYYSGRAYGPSVVQNANGTLTMLFAGYRIPTPIGTAGTVLGTNSSAQYTIGTTDPTAYRNILTETLTSSTSPAVTTQVAVGASPATPVVGQSVTYTATVSVPAPGTGNPTGTVTFTGGAGTLCSAVAVSESSPDIASCTTTYTTAQTDAVTASYSGDSNYASSTGTLNETIAAASTTTALSASASSGVVGQSITYRAAVSAVAPGAGTPTGAVSFTGNGGVLCSAVALSGGVASCTTSYSAAQTDSVTASYAGDGNFAASSSGAVGEPITAASTSTLLAGNPTSPVVGQPVTYTATVAVSSPGAGNPTGTVSFTGNSGTLCAAAALSGTSPDTATCTVTYSGAQSDSLSATYGGSVNYLGSTGTATESVGRAATTTTNLAAPTSVVVGQSVTFTATVAVNSPGAGTATGTVTFTGNGGTLCSAVGLTGTSPDTATCTVSYAAAQTDSVGAAYSGDSNFVASSGSVNLVVAPAATTTAVTAGPAAPVVGQAVTYTATVTATAPGAGIATGTVTFSDAGGTLCANVPLSATSPDTAQCVQTYSSAQTDAVTATYAGDSNYAGSSGELDETIAPIATTTTVTGLASVTVGQAVSYTASVAQTGPGSGTPSGTVSFTNSGVAIGSCAALALPASAPYQVTCTVTQSALGGATVAATYSGDGSFAGSTGSETVTASYGPVATITATPGTASIAGGSTQAYVVTGRDSYGNSLGDVSSSATLTIAPDGTCWGDLCTAAIPGAHQVHVTVGSATASVALTVTAGPAVSPVADVVGVGDDLSQYGLDFVADGNALGAPGLNSAGNAQRMVDIDATADAGGGTAYASNSTVANPVELDPTVVLAPGTKPVQRPSSSSAGLAALLADTGSTQQIDYVRSSQLPSAAEQAAAGADGWGGLDVIRFATDTLQIATAARSHAPAGLSLAELVKIYDGTYRTWGSVPGYQGAAPSASIEPLLPAAGTDTRSLFDADLAAANGGAPVVYGSDVLVVGDDDVNAILAAPSPADAIDPFSGGQLSLIAQGYFGSDVQAAVSGLDGTAPDGGASYDASHPLYVIVRDRDVAATAHWLGSARNWANILFVGSNDYVGSSRSSALIAAAGLTPSYANLGDISQ